MKLVELSCDQPCFRTIQFRPSGITLIVGDGKKTADENGNSNGVGKTLSLGLIHHCLGGSIEPRLVENVPNWVFSLTFVSGHTEYTVERAGHGKLIRLNGEIITLKHLREWLTREFLMLRPDDDNIGFRSQFRRFARYNKSDSLDPIRLDKESEYDALLRTMFLFNADLSLIRSKKRQKLLLDSARSSQKNWKTDQVLKDLLSGGAKPELRLGKLERDIPTLEEKLKSFQVAENYRDIEEQANSLTRAAREIETTIGVLDFQIGNIQDTLQFQPDISKEDLLQLYDGLTQVFKPDALAHFDAVEKFHESLFANRRARLEEERSKLILEKAGLESNWSTAASKRDELLQTLQGKQALDEYATSANYLAQLKAERDRLVEFVNFSNSVQEIIQNIKEELLAENKQSIEYVDAEPIKRFASIFSDLAEQLYPERSSGILLENNDGENQVRYDLTVQIEGDKSDGINDARILCFDWLIFLQGVRHKLGMLWHDNRLFANVDPGVRAKWFEIVDGALTNSDRQYIATINTENFDAMKSYFSEPQWKRLQSAVVMKLKGDSPENRLMGIQF